VGLLRSFFLETAAPEVREAVQAAASALAGHGAIVDEVTLGHLAEIPAATMAIIGSEALAYHAEWVRTRADEYQADVIERLRMAAYVTGVQYVRAQQLRALVRDDVDGALAAHDVLLAPTTPITAPRVGEREVALGSGRSDVRSALIRFTRPINFSGHPACSVPCGVDGQGLPIGMQIIGRSFDEATVLRVADAYQRFTDWHARRPVID
jgi:aspartyl-tRNA(Asn)/glutamyl-tRNA(Gln) amidotransferase subunit A